MEVNTKFDIGTYLDGAVYVTPNEACRYLGVTTAYLSYLHKTGRGGPERIMLAKRMHLYRLDDVLSWDDNGRPLEKMGPGQ